MSTEIPSWSISGDWFDVCKCSIPCPCIFAQAPTYGDCEGVLAYHIKKGHYGETMLDGLNALFVGSFKGNIWAGEAKDASMFYFLDERADNKQREALEALFMGRAGGFLAEFAKMVGRNRGVEYAPIKFEVADDLAYWQAEVPGKVVAKAEALAGPMTPKGKRVQLFNAPGSETGPGQVATWGKAIANNADAGGFKFDWKGRSSKHIPFDWSGP